LIINGTSTGNVYPLSMTKAGLVGTAGTVTIAANVTLITANVWQNHGATTATDGTGFNGAITPQVLFLKNSTATLIAP